MIMFETTQTTTSTDPVPAAGTDSGHAPIPQIDLYRDIHKGIRLELFGITLAAGQLDCSDRVVSVPFAERVDRLGTLLEQHAEHEDGWIQPLVEQHLPAAATRIATDHAAFDVRFADICEMAGALALAGGEPARSIGHEVYLELASFVSAYLSHQDLEERVVMPTLAQVMTPLEILQVHETIIGSIPPAEMADALALMIPAMNIDDRTELLGGMRAGAPAEVFAGVWGLVGSVLAPADVAAVAARLGIPT
jgi:hypothetical protein